MQGALSRRGLLASALVLPAFGRHAAALEASAVGRSAITPQDFLAAGARNHQEAIQAAVDAAAAVGGARVFLPPPAEGRYTLTTPVLIRGSGVQIEGASGLTLVSMTGPNQDGFVFDGRTAQGGQIIRCALRNLTILGDNGTPSAGHAVTLVKCAETTLQDVSIESAFQALLIDTTNSITLRSVILNNSRGEWAVRWTAAAGDRSDVLNIEDLTIQNAYRGAHGLVCDGNVQTLRWKGGSIMGARIAVWFRSRRSTVDFPGHFYLYNLETDGQIERSLLIEAGVHIWFVACDISNTSGSSTAQGNDEMATIEIRPDTGFSDVHDIQFVGGRYGNSRRQAMVLDGRDIRVVGATVGDASKAGVGAFPAIEVGSNARQVLINANSIGCQAPQPARVSHAVRVMPGSRAVQIKDNIFTGLVGEGVELVGAAAAEPSIIVSGNLID